MASTPLKYLNQYILTALNVGGGIDNSQTTGIVLQSVTGLDITKAGVALLTYADPINTSTAEWITYTSINGSNELQGVVRGAEGFSAKAHLNQAVVAFPLSESHINNLNAMFDSTGADFAQIATPASPSSGRNKLYFKSDGLAYKLNSSGTEQAIEPNLTTKGDIQTFSTVLARLAVGTNGQRLVAASGETTGLSWQSMTLGYAEVTSNQGSITTIVDLTSLSVTVTVPAGARIKITGFGVMYQAATAGSVAIGIYEGATLLNEAVEQLTTANLQQSMSVFSVLTPSTGSHTYKLRGNAVLGSGAVTLNATATTPAFILVEMI
jgi:hypothetical protein